MSVRVMCQCGTSFELKDEFAGRLVKCPQCGRENRVPGTAAAVATTPQADPAFDRDVFLLRQQMLRISEKYDVCDEQGQKIVYVERPAHFLRNLGAILAGLVAAGVFIGLCLAGADAMKGSAGGSILGLIGIVGFLPVLLLVAVPLSSLRHVTFYRDQSKRERLLEILQDKKFQPIIATYTVRDARGRPMVKLAKNYLYNIFRKRWYVRAPSGTVLYTAREDSIILSLLRRLIGPLLGILRTNFIICRGESDEVIGEFNRKFTILDRYVLDLKADGARSMDRRVALALGVMLDTGERR